MQELVMYLIIFSLVYLIYFGLVILRSKKLNQYKKSTEVLYLERKYKLNVNKMDIKKLSNLLALANAFIISTTVYLISFIDNLFIKMVVGFVLMIPIILGVYHVIGTYLQKKGLK